jgi:GH24 family phage-related lysozyme (muramidase)
VRLLRSVVFAGSMFATVLFAKAARLETQHEGRRAHVYDDDDGSPLDHNIRRKDGKKCIGHPTVGIGCNLDRHGVRSALAAVGADYQAVRLGDADLTDEQIDRLFEGDLTAALTEVQRIFPDLFDLPEVVQLVLVDMTFNCGSVRGWPGLRREIGRRNWHGMIAEMRDSDWWRGVTRGRAEHDIALIREALDLPREPLTDPEREKVMASVAIVLDQTIREELSERDTIPAPPPEPEA